MSGSSRNAELTHQLRNQLNNIAMNAELAKLELTSPEGASLQVASEGTPLQCVEAILQACAECADVMSALAELNDKSS